MTGPKLTGLPTTPSNAALPQAAAKTAGPPAPGNPDRPSEGEAFGRLLADLDQPVPGAALRGKPLPDPPVSKVADAAQASSQPMIVRDAARNGTGLDAPSLDVDDKPAANLTPLQKALKLLASRKGPQEVSSPHPAAAAEALPSLEIAGQPINAVASRHGACRTTRRTTGRVWADRALGASRKLFQRRTARVKRFARTRNSGPDEAECRQYSRQ